MGSKPIEGDREEPCERKEGGTEGSQGARDGGRGLLGDMINNTVELQGYPKCLGHSFGALVWRCV